MKRLSIPVFLLSMTLLVTPAFGSNVPPTQVGVVNLWTTLGTNPFPSLTAVSPLVSGSFTLPSLHPSSGTYKTQVFKQNSNGFLVFVYQVALNAAASKNNPKGNPANADVQKISTGDWDDSITINAKQWANASGETAASGINRLNGVVTMYLQNPLLRDGKTSYFLLLYTNARSYTPDTVGIQDGSATTVNGFVPLPTPEPSCMSLLGLGIAGLGLLRKNLQR